MFHCILLQNLFYKVENQWDDYEEVYHCSKLIQEVKKNKNMNMDFHIMKKDENLTIEISEKKAKLIHRCERNYFEVLNEKLRWGN